MSSQSYCSCSHSHRYIPSYSCRCGKYQGAFHFVCLVLGWACLRIPLVQSHNHMVKVASAEHFQAASFPVHHKRAQSVLFSRPLHGNYCKTFSLQHWQPPAWPSYVLLASCCKGKEEYLKKNTSRSRRNPHAYNTPLQRGSMFSENSVKEEKSPESTWRPHCFWNIMLCCG